MSETPDCATFKLATRVVDVTVNGAVPVAMFDTKRLAVTLPVTFALVSVPTVVTFGCDAVVSVPPIRTDVKVPVILLNVKFALPPNVLLSLNCTCVLLPATEPEPPDPS